jgi:hypothetical protein
MCQKCGCQNIETHSCGCKTTGNLITLDATAILYHKNNNEVSELTNLELTNGATLELFMKTVDTYIGQIKASNWVFPILEGQLSYTINTVQQFAAAVDAEMGILRKFKGDFNADPVGTVDGDYWFRTDLPVANGLRIQLNGNVRTIPTT